MFQNARCGLCGATPEQADVLFIFDTQSVVRCRSCGLVYVTPWINDDDLTYKDAEYFVQKQAYLERKDEMSVYFKDILDHVEGHKHNKGKWLDVGCGVGFLLEMAREHGWDCWGVELSEWAARYAVDELGLRVFRGEIFDAKFSSSHFDVITINHVLEHVPDPLEMLREVHRTIKDDGLLVVGVPNFGSLVARVRGRKWKMLAPSEHRWHFTPATLENALKKGGFTVVKWSTHGENYLVGRRISWMNMFKSVVTGFAAVMNMGESVLFLAEKD